MRDYVKQRFDNWIGPDGCDTSYKGSDPDWMEEEERWARLRYMDEDLRNDGLLPELSSLRSVYEQLSTLLELSDGRRKKKDKPEFPEDKKY